MVERKKILYIVEAMGGGVFTYLVDLANQLINEFDIYIGYGTRPQTPINYKNYFDARIHLIRVENFVREINLVKDLKAIQEVKEIVEKIKPDIIHLHSSKAGVIGRVAFDGKKIPLFYTPHGYSFLMQNCNPLTKKIFKAIEAIMARCKCKTISCSLGEHEETLKLTKNATYVNNAINVEELEKKLKKIEQRQHPFTVFTLGRICCQKNPSLFNQIAEKMPGTKFLWIGDGELKEELKSNNIEVTGWVDREEALKRSKNADVFVLTSLWEGLPISLLEAMYMKKLCIVSNVIGNRNVIHNGDNGFLCDTADEFVKAVKRGNEHLIENAYHDILENYDVKGQAEKYSKIYKTECSK